MLSYAILDNLWLSLAIPGYEGLYHQVFSIRVHLEAGESMLWLFKSFWLFIYFFPGRVLEELALRKRIFQIIGFMVFKSTVLDSQFQRKNQF